MAITTFLIGIDPERMKGWLAERAVHVVILGACLLLMTGSPFVHVTAEFVRRFADLEGIMRICTEPAVFETAFREALKSN